MSHEYRVWFIGDMNKEANDFLCRGNIEGFDPETDFSEFGVKIHGEIICKNLARVPFYRDVTIMNDHRKIFGMVFNVYVKDSPGSIIVPWFGNKAFSEH